MNTESNNYFQLPVVFFSSGLPSETFCVPPGQNRQPPNFSFGRPDRQNRRNVSLKLFKSIAILVLSLYALTMAIRFMMFLFDVLFSPPVLLLCLFVLVLNQSHWENHSFYVRDFDMREFERLFRNPCRLRRFFNMNERPDFVRFATVRRPAGNSNAGTATHTTRARHQPATARGEQQQSDPSPNMPGESLNANEFEVITALNLLAGTQDGTTPVVNSSNNTSTTGSSSSNNDHNNSGIVNANNYNPGLFANDDNDAQYQKVQIHSEETDDALVLSMDISGFTVENIEITVENSLLCIRGERKNKIGDVFAIEEFVELDQERVLEDSVVASVSDSILEVKIEKKVPPQPRVISITDKEKDE